MPKGKKKAARARGRTERREGAKDGGVRGTTREEGTENPVREAPRNVAVATFGLAQPMVDNKVRATLWECQHCLYKNWQIRGSCNVCMRTRPQGARIFAEWWLRSKIPADALREPSGNAPTRRVPGLAPPTGRKPVQFSAGQQQQPQQQQRQGDNKGGEGNKATQPGGPKGGGKGRREQEGAAGEQDEGDGEGEKPGAPQLPPERAFQPPKKPREELVQDLARCEAKVEKARAKNGGSDRVKQLEEERDELQRLVKSAGGRTQQSLGFEIRKEEDNSKKTADAITRCDERLQQLEVELAATQERIEGEKKLRDRLVQRKGVAEQRLACLAAQKARESIPQDFLASVRQAATGIFSSDDVALRAVQDLLRVLVAPRAVDMASDDDSYSSSGITVAEMGLEEQDKDDLELFAEESRRQIEEKRRELDQARGNYRVAVEAAMRAEPKQVKRKAGKSEPETEDEAMLGDKETPALDPWQVTACHQHSIVRLTAELEHIEAMARRESVPVPAADATGHTRDTSPQQKRDQAVQQQRQQYGSSGSSGVQPPQQRVQQQEQQQQRQQRQKQQHNDAQGQPSSSSSQLQILPVVQNHLGSLAVSEAAAGAQESQGRDEHCRGARRRRGWGDDDEEPAGISAVHKADAAQKEIELLKNEIQKKTEANAEMALQARLQLQQEQELRQLATMAVVRREAGEITRAIAQRAATRSTAPYSR